MITEFNGEVIKEYEDSEPWEFYEHLVLRTVDGSLAEKVLARVGSSEGVVQSIERRYSSGTCELCGYGEEGITILVDGVIVFKYSADDGSFYYQEDMPDEIISPFVVFNNWLRGAESGTVDTGYTYAWPGDESDE